MLTVTLPFYKSDNDCDNGLSDEIFNRKLAAQLMSASSTLIYEDDRGKLFEISDRQRSAFLFLSRRSGRIAFYMPFSEIDTIDGRQAVEACCWLGFPSADSAGIRDKVIFNILARRFSIVSSIDRLSRLGLRHWLDMVGHAADRGWQVGTSRVDGSIGWLSTRSEFHAWSWQEQLHEIAAAPVGQRLFFVSGSRIATP